MASADTMSNRRPGLARSDDTYSSFHDIELFPPASPPKNQGQPIKSITSSMKNMGDNNRENIPPFPTTIKRSDSGYESLPRASISSSSSGEKPRSSNISSCGGPRSRPPTCSGLNRSQSRPTSSRGRPVIRRSPKSSPYVHPVHAAATATNPFDVSRLHLTNQSHSSYVHFPTHPTELAVATLSQPAFQHPQLELEPESPTTAVAQASPQPTHYWTSDRTRRLEYAAIDAAHRGLKGWVRRHLVPDCFIPREKTRVAFDDDSGSVRRYRLDLDDEDDEPVSPVNLIPVGSEKVADVRTETKRPSLWGRIRTW